MNDLGVSLHHHLSTQLCDSFAGAMAQRKLVDGSLLFNEMYFNPEYVFVHQGASPVLGVQRVAPRWLSPAVLELVNRPFAPWTGSLKAFGERAVERLREHIIEHWDASHPTLVLHSSGYDSRILSSILAELRDDCVDLGRIHFRCHGPEGDAFEQIMQRQGWDRSQYSRFTPPAEDCFDVGRWDRPGHSAWLAVTSLANCWSDIVPWDEEKNWNLLSGTGGGEGYEYATIGKAPFVDWTYCANPNVQRWLGYFPDGTDVIVDMEKRFRKVMFPYFGERHIATVAEVSPTFLKYEMNGCDMVRASMLRTFRDTTLDIKRVTRTYAWNVSAKRWAEMRDAYASSRFLRDVKGAPQPDKLISSMQATFAQGRGYERLWRLAALWEQIA